MIYSDFLLAQQVPHHEQKLVKGKILPQLSQTHSQTLAEIDDGLFR